jgi:hypothetical protein
MILVRMMGGIGNQFFQYSFGRCLSYKNNDKLILDTTQMMTKKVPESTYSLNDYNIKARILDDELQRNTLMGLKPFKRFRDKEIVHKELFQEKESLYLNGYWQSELYFKDIESLIREELTLKQGIDTPILKEIQGKNSIALHVRRTGYLQKPDVDIFMQYGKEYYDRALKILLEKIDNPTLYIFSDDIDWCEKEMKFDVDTIYTPKQDRMIDFELMRNCKHFIIPNSTFSWWGAWLSNYKDKIVIVPKRWKFVDDVSIQVCKGWIAI